MIKYNWEVIKKYTKNDPQKIIDYFKNVYVLKGAMYSYLKKEKWAADIYNETLNKETSGENNSFIINIDDFIINDINATLMEQYVYLDLASKRDYFTYVNTKGAVIFLPIWKVSHLYEVDKLTLNRLLMIESNNIYFIYEGEF